jgi:hypothetical protein
LLSAATTRTLENPREVAKLDSSFLIFESKSLN